MKRGTKFIHARWMDERHQPLVCEVTAVRDGYVYWRDAGSARGAKHCFPVEEAGTSVREVLAVGKAAVHGSTLEP